jgi:sugar phosphate isomerase/epimerase
MNNNIQLSLTLYSLTEEYVSGRFTLEECLAKAQEMGYKGIELVACQMIPEYPHPSRQWMDTFIHLLNKYDLHPVCYSAYIDMGTHSDRDLNEAEIIQSTINDLTYAEYMGFDLVRTQHAISPAIYEKMLPYAKKIGIPLAIEMHHPHNPDVPVWKEYLKLMAKGDGYLGVVPDFSIFAENPHFPHMQQAIQEYGCRKEKVEEIAALHAAGHTEEELSSGDYTAGEKKFIKEVYDMYGSGKANIKWLDDVLPYTLYIHGKFWYMGPDEIDHVVPCDKLLPEIKKSGYKGYIASEYEGHHYTMYCPDLDSCQQLTRWVRMTNRILGRS